ncbi:hypothetical protein [Methanothermococcus okinawensis]|nr:hypothetical protein [Methanothermococcus okinawensis]
MDLMNYPNTTVIITFIAVGIVLCVFYYMQKKWINMPFHFIISRIFMFSSITIMMCIALGILSWMISENDPIGANGIISISALILMMNSMVMMLCNTLSKVGENSSNGEIPSRIQFKKNLGIIFITSLLTVVAIILYVFYM